MYFGSYNDFELLYLVEDGSELAFNFLYLKYSFYIRKTAKKYFPYGDKMHDLVQEGLMVLDKCIRQFNQCINVTFYTYVTICINRRFNYIIRKSDYYNPHIYLEEDYGEYGNKNHSYIRIPEYMSTDNVDVLLYQEVILEGLSLPAFCKKYNLKYSNAYKRRKTIISEIKKMLTN